LQQQESLQERRRIQEEWTIPVQNEKALFSRYHIVVLIVNLIYETGIGNDEMNGGNWKIDVRSVEYR
jgi:hypothetical protein